MSLEEIFAKIPKQANKSRVRSLKRIRKGRIRAVKFSKRKDSFVILTGYTRCKDCGVISGLTRMGCPECRGLNIDWGILVNAGLIEKNRFKCAVQQTEFITYKELHKRLISGERFLDAGSLKPLEITLKHFKK